MRKSISDTITDTITGLNQIGVVDEITMKNIKSLCIPDIPDYKPEEIIRLRKNAKLSQAAMASIFNLSPSTIQKWEQGKKRPDGASKKLLDIFRRKGIEALI